MCALVEVYIPTRYFEAMRECSNACHFVNTVLLPGVGIEIDVNASAHTGVFVERLATYCLCQLLLLRLAHFTADTIIADGNRR